MTSELKNRWIWGVGAGILCVVTMFWLGPEASFFVAAACGIQGWREYSRLMDLKDRPSFYYLGYLITGIMFTYTFFVGAKSIFWLWFIWVTGFVAIFIDYRIEKHRTSLSTFDIQKTWTHLCRFILGLFYIFMVFGFIGPIISKVNGEQLLTLTLVAVFLGDTSAFFVGKSKGRRKLWPELSPGKTIEGAFGGWAGSIVFSMILWCVFRLIFKERVLPFWEFPLVGFLAGPLSQAGDLLESLMKRVSGRKDSGTLLPGHGGILDRADGLVFVMPLVYFLF